MCLGVHLCVIAFILMYFGGQTWEGLFYFIFTVSVLMFGKFDLHKWHQNQNRVYCQVGFTY